MKPYFMVAGIKVLRERAFWGFNIKSECDLRKKLNTVN